MMPTFSFPLPLFLLLLVAACAEPAPPAPVVVPQWQKVTLDFSGPATAEAAAPNPFTDYRLDVTFTHADTTMVIPGFYAADGNAAQTSADSGNTWRVRFRPPLAGEWTYSAQLRAGADVVYAADPSAGTPLVLEQAEGRLRVIDPVPGETGRLVRRHPRYLQWAGTGELFLKGGADSPENLLAYADFDGTYRYRAADREGESTATQEFLHRYEPHRADFNPGDPTWQNGKGRGLIGGLNYLAGKGVNAIYFLTMNIGGDGLDVWPYTHEDERRRFDVSKLAQWEILFDHADSLGMLLHFVLQETENERLLDGGDTGPERQLYYRELVARFGHHRAVTWNLGEENGPAGFSPDGQTTAQREAMIDWFARHDPYQNYLVIHTHAGEEERDAVLDPLLGNADLDGLALQVFDPYRAPAVVRQWLASSAAAGAPWVVTVDEIGPWWRGIDPDARAPDNNQDSVRALTLWGSLLSGAAGVEWYFAAYNPHNDLGLEDWRSRDRVWDWTRHALDFFREHLPFDVMQAYPDLVAEGQYAFAQPGIVYAVGLPFGRSAALDLSGQTGEYSVRWYNPRTGGALQTGSVATVTGGERVDLGRPPDSSGPDWVVLVRRAGDPPR
jgi:hypothetical protein